MKNLGRKITIIFCAVFFVGFIIYQIVTPHSDGMKTEIQTSEESMQVSSPYIESIEMQEKIKSELESELPQNIKGYISSIDDGINVYFLDDELDVTVRVTILPDAIPMVADNICTIVKQLTSQNDIPSFRISVRYYMESNAEGIDKKTEKEWHTSDGYNGVYVESTGMYKMTLDELYEHFNDYGKN